MNIGKNIIHFLNEESIIAKVIRDMNRLIGDYKLPNRWGNFKAYFRSLPERDVYHKFPYEAFRATLMMLEREMAGEEKIGDCRSWPHLALLEDLEKEIAECPSSTKRRTPFEWIKFGRNHGFL
jgi:hypothetical protein